MQVREETRVPELDPEPAPVELRNRDQEFRHRVVLAAEELGEAGRGIASVHAGMVARRSSRCGNARICVLAREVTSISATPPGARSRRLTRAERCESGLLAPLRSAARVPAENASTPRCDLLGSPESATRLRRSRAPPRLCGRCSTGSLRADPRSRRFPSAKPPRPSPLLLCPLHVHRPGPAGREASGPGPICDDSGGRSPRSILAIRQRDSRHRR